MYKKSNSFIYKFVVNCQVFQITPSGCTQWSWKLACLITWTVLFETPFFRYLSIFLDICQYLSKLRSEQDLNNIDQNQRIRITRHWKSKVPGSTKKHKKCKKQIKIKKQTNIINQGENLKRLKNCIWKTSFFPKKEVLRIFQWIKYSQWLP